MDQLDYRSWDTEQCLRECLQSALDRGFEVRLEAGNEPDIELAQEPVDEWGHVRDATRIYADWFHLLAGKVRADFGDRVQIAVAALSQGTPERFLLWKARLKEFGCYAAADYISEHLYSDGRPLNDPDWLGRWQAWDDIHLPMDVTELNDNGALASQDPHERAEHFAAMISALQASDRVRSVSLFTLPGSPDDDNHPSWWLLTPEIVERLALFQDPPAASHTAPTPPPVVEPPVPTEPAMPVSEIEQFIRSAAAARGIDPDTAVRVATSEGGVDEPARRGTFNTGSSWWPFQLHYGGPGYERYGTTAGMGTGFTELTGWQPGDPAAWRDSVRYALNRARLYGWGAWFGAAAAGVGPWDGIDRSRPWAASAERWDYEGQEANTMSTLTYNPDAPVDLQPDDWSCSEQSAQWMLRALGRNPGDAWIRDQLLSAGLVTKEKGLMDASGASLAAWLQREYGDEMGLTFTNDADVDWDELVEIAGEQPIILGGRKWHHWTGVRYPTQEGTLALANPAPNWQAAGNELDRDEFDRLGPWSLITVVPTAAAAPAPTPSRAAVLVAEIRERLNELEGLVA